MLKTKISNEEYMRNVYINCPYDDGYLPLFIAIVFAVHDLGFKPRCALETSNFGKNRLDKIVEIIGQCKYSIHDLSRTELDSATEFPRFNMALELGLDLGCSRYGNQRQRQKVSLVMDVDPLRYRAFISDTAGQDIYSHESNEEKAISIVREWLGMNQESIISSSAKIHERYKMFLSVLPIIATNYGFKIEHMPYLALSYSVAYWLSKNPRTQRP